MAQYLIYFNDEWVTEASDEEWQERSRRVGALREEMKAAGVYILRRRPRQRRGGLPRGAARWRACLHRWAICGD